MGLALAEVKKKGWEILIKEMGYADATKFILLYESGKGDYTKDRKKFFKNLTIDKIFKEIKDGIYK